MFSCIYVCCSVGRKHLTRGREGEIVCTFTELHQHHKLVSLFCRAPFRDEPLHTLLSLRPFNDSCLSEWHPICLGDGKQSTTADFFYPFAIVFRFFTSTSKLSFFTFTTHGSSEACSENIERTFQFNLFDIRLSVPVAARTTDESESNAAYPCCPTELFLSLVSVIYVMLLEICLLLTQFSLRTEGWEISRATAKRSQCDWIERRLNTDEISRRSSFK